MRSNKQVYNEKSSIIMFNLIKHTIVKFIIQNLTSRYYINKETFFETKKGIKDH